VEEALSGDGRRVDMPAEFVYIYIDEMHDFLTEHGYYHVETSAWEFVYEKTIHRYVYKMGGFRTVVRVFTSVDSRTGVSRDKGKDAIRVVPLIVPGECMMTTHQVDDNYPKLKSAYPVRKEKRVHRVANWKNNMSSRLEDAENITVKKSPMGWPMTLRKGKHGLFWSSIGYPMEVYSETYRD
jgi:hypothetical protein